MVRMHFVEYRLKTCELFHLTFPSWKVTKTSAQNVGTNKNSLGQACDSCWHQFNFIYSFKFWADPAFVWPRESEKLALKKGEYGSMHKISKSFVIHSWNLHLLNFISSPVWANSPNKTKMSFSSLSFNIFFLSR